LHEKDKVASNTKSDRVVIKIPPPPKKKQKKAGCWSLLLYENPRIEFFIN